MYYGNWLRKITEALQRISDVPGHIAGITRIIEDHQANVYRDNKERNLRENIREEREEKVYCENQVFERERAAREERQYHVQNSVRLATWLAFFAAVIYGAVAAFQWHTMNSTYVEIKKQTAAAERAANAAAESAAASKLAADAATDGLTFTKESFRQDQRPYIIVPLNTTSNFENVGSGPRAGHARMWMIVQNYGKTPAVDIRFYGAIAVGKDQVHHLDQLHIEGEAARSGILAPDTQTRFAILSRPLKDGVVRLSDPIVFYGRIEYTDIFPGKKPRYRLFFCQQISQGPDAAPDIGNACNGKDYIQ